MKQLSDRIRHLSFSAQITAALRRFYAHLREEGIEGLWRRVMFRWSIITRRDNWRFRADLPTRRALRRQRKNPIPGAPKISVVVPVYNTPVRFLRQMLNSVFRQSAPNWQLVLVDASDAAHGRVSRMVRRAARDARVVCKKIENGGIAANTTEGFAMADGEYIALLDHDDVLYPNALYEIGKAIVQTGAKIVYTDEIVLSENLRHLAAYHFKPDFSPDTLRGCNYIAHLLVFSRALLEQAGKEERPEFDGAQDHDLILRLTERLRPEEIVHLPKCLYVWRSHPQSTAQSIEGAKAYALSAGERAVDAQLARLGLAGKTESIPGCPGAYRVRYALPENPQDGPLVSVIVRSGGEPAMTARCIESLYAHAGSVSFEALLVEQGARDERRAAYYRGAEERYPHLRVLWQDKPLSPAEAYNEGRRAARGAHLLFLHDGIEMLSDGFLDEMLMYSQRPDVGCVGAKLFARDDTIRHAGLFLGVGGAVGVNHKGHPRGSMGDLYRLATAQNMTAVGGGCVMVKAADFDAAGGFEETLFPDTYYEADLCLRLRRQGRWNVYTPFAQGYSYEDEGTGGAGAGDAARRARETEAFRARYAGELAGGDPFYNRHFTVRSEDYSAKYECAILME